MLNIPKDFREFIELLNENSVRYLVVGGCAVAFHGLPRSTGGIDFFFDRSAENARLVVRCLQQLGFILSGISGFLTECKIKRISNV
ncbi:MAG: hypothetical protein CMN78_05630 [Spirochaetales bacterium]|nr:hypothetical protein [Spirochaetales bacterium]